MTNVRKVGVLLFLVTFSPILYHFLPHSLSRNSNSIMRWHTWSESYANSLKLAESCWVFLWVSPSSDPLLLPSRSRHWVQLLVACGNMPWLVVVQHRRQRKTEKENKLVVKPGVKWPVPWESPAAPGTDSSYTWWRWGAIEERRCSLVSNTISWGHVMTLVYQLSSYHHG